MNEEKTLSEISGCEDQEFTSIAWVSICVWMKAPLISVTVWDKAEAILTLDLNWRCRESSLSNCS